MKRILCFCAVLALFFTACTSDIKSTTPANNKPATPTEKQTSYGNPYCPEIDTTVIYDSDLLTITVTELEYNPTYKTYVIKTTIQNHSPRAINYSLEYAKVNGYTISAWVFGEIYSEMEAHADFGLPRDEIQFAGIKAIQEIKFDFVCQFSDNDEKICTASANLKTSDYGTISEEYDFDGTEVYVSEEYRIMLAPNDNPSVSHPLKVYIENKTDHPLMLMYESIAINQLMVMEFMSGAYALPYSQRIEEMTITYFGEKPEIDMIDSVTLGVQILPYDSDGSFSIESIIKTPPAIINMDRTDNN